ncbi:unnamed protein product, partial [Effrenium voratum]
MEGEMDLAEAWSAVAELRLLKDQAAPKEALLVAVQALEAARESGFREVEARLALAEAKLLTSGPGSGFQIALEEARQAAGSQGTLGAVGLLRLEGCACLARRRPEEALRCAERMKAQGERR